MTHPIPPIDVRQCATCHHQYAAYWVKCPQCGDRHTRPIPIPWATDTVVWATLLGGILLGMALGLTLAAALGWIPPA